MIHTLEERFWSKVEKTDGCWIWTAYLSPNGYGRLWDGRSRTAPVKVLAHRVSWMLAHGEIPEDLEVCHRCDNPACVRPDHLFLACHAGNMDDMVAKGRQAIGVRNARTRLRPEDVVAIRELAGHLSQRKIAAKYGVCRGTIQSILEGRSWVYV